MGRVGKTRNLGRLRYTRRRFSWFQGVACDMNNSSDELPRRTRRKNKNFAPFRMASWMSSLLRFSLGRIAAPPLIRRFDGDILERDGAGVLNDLARFDPAKRAVDEPDVFDHRAGKARDPHHART